MSKKPRQLRVDYHPIWRKERRGSMLAIFDEQGSVIYETNERNLADAHVAALAQLSALQGRVDKHLPDVDELAQIIRRVDGNHSLGAGALAEAIIAVLKEQPK